MNSNEILVRFSSAENTVDARTSCNTCNMIAYLALSTIMSFIQFIILLPSVASLPLRDYDVKIMVIVVQILIFHIFIILIF